MGQFGIRVGPAMSEYVLEQLGAARSTNEFPVMGGDARTGVAVRRLIARDALLDSIAHAKSS